MAWRFHRTLRRELLDEVGAFASVEHAQAALDQLVHAYNTERPHQSLEMQPPAALFRPRPGDALPPPSAGGALLSDTEPVDAARSTPSETRSEGAWEIEMRVPPSGIVPVVGTQRVWAGKSLAGCVVTLWVDTTTIHVLLDDEVLRTIPSHLTSADLVRLSHRGARPGRAAPAGAALGRDAPVHAVVEVDRTATRDGIVAVAGHQLSLGPADQRRRVTLRIDRGLIHAIADRHLIKRSRAHCSPAILPDSARPARQPRLCHHPRPPALTVFIGGCRWTASRWSSVIGQLLRIGRTHAGKIVTILVEDHHIRVLDRETELPLHARIMTKPLRNYNAPRTQQRKASPENETSNIS
jgi:hypothetical protein